MILSVFSWSHLGLYAWLHLAGRSCGWKGTRSFLTCLTVDAAVSAGALGLSSMWPHVLKGSGPVSLHGSLNLPTKQKKSCKLS